MSNKPIFFCDLDQTMIFSRRVVDAHRDTYNGLVVVETYNGGPSAFMTLDASAALCELDTLIDFVPCTTRSAEQYDRVSLPKIFPQHVILDNGAKILTKGKEDKIWAKKMKNLIAEESANPADIYTELHGKFSHEEWYKKIRTNDDMFVSVISHGTLPEHFIEYVSSRVDAWNYMFSVQAKTIYMIPKGVSKERAAQELASRHNSSIVFAAGDSFLDLGMMRWADHAIRPAHGELQEKKMAEDIKVTTKSGPQAGEQILEFVTLSVR